MKRKKKAKEVEYFKKGTLIITRTSIYFDYMYCNSLCCCCNNNEITLVLTMAPILLGLEHVMAQRNRPDVQY
jgi:hypothetical protein